MEGFCLSGYKSVDCTGVNHWENIFLKLCKHDIFEKIWRWQTQVPYVMRL